MVISKKAVFFLCYILVITLLIVLPINGKESALNNTYLLHLRADYLGHAFLFLPWMWLKPEVTYRPPIWFWFFGGIIFAALTEGIQYLLPYRSFNINDLMANSAGVTLGMFGCLIFRKS